MSEFPTDIIKQKFKRTTKNQEETDSAYEEIPFQKHDTKKFGIHGQKKEKQFESFNQDCQTRFANEDKRQKKYSVEEAKSNFLHL